MVAAAGWAGARFSGSFLPAALGRALRARRSWRAWSLRQGGQGLGSPAHVHLKPGLNGRSSAGSVASTTSARSPSGRARRRGWRTGDFRPQRSDSPAFPSPCPPCRSTHLPLEEWRVSAHRGPRQLRRRRNAANEAVAGRQRGRFASSPPRSGFFAASRALERGGEWCCGQVRPRPEGSGSPRIAPHRCRSGHARSRFEECLTPLSPGIEVRYRLGRQVPIDQTEGRNRPLCRRWRA